MPGESNPHAVIGSSLLTVYRGSVSFSLPLHSSATHIRAAARSPAHKTRIGRRYVSLALAYQVEATALSIPSAPCSCIHSFAPTFLISCVMSNRASFLSTTGLLRSTSSASAASVYSTKSNATKPSTITSQTEKPASRLQRLKNLKKLKLSPTSSDASPKPKRRITGGVIPMGSTFIVGMAVVMSLCFVMVISFAFIGAEDAPVFKDVLNDLAQHNPGVSLRCA